MSKHLASPNLKTIFIEAAHKEVFGEDTPDRNGEHRATESK